MLYRVLIGCGIGLAVGLVLAIVRKLCASGWSSSGSPILLMIFGAMAGALIGFVTHRLEPIAAVTTAGEFRSDVLGAERPVMVDFYTDRCPACRVLAPVFAALAKEYDEEVDFVKIDCRQAPGVARQYGIRAVPTVILFDEGEEVRRWLGARRPEEYQDALNYYVDE